VADVLFALILFTVGWMILRRRRDRLGLDMVAVLAFPVGLAAWGATAAAAFAAGLLHHPAAVTGGVVAVAVVAGLRQGPCFTMGEAKALAAASGLVGGLAILIHVLEPNVFGASEDPRWYLAIGQQVLQWGGIDPSLKGQLGTRPFLLPFLVAAANAFGQGYFTVVEPLCAATAVACVFAFGRRLGAGTAVSALAAAGLALCPPFLWSAFYVDPHAEFAVLLVAATGSLLMAQKDGETFWLVPFTLCTAVLALARVEGSLCGAGLLALALARPELPLTAKVRAVAVAGGFQALWYLFVLRASFAHGGLTVYQLAIFAAVPAGFAALAAVLPAVQHRNARLAGLIAGLLPKALMAALVAGIALHEILWPYSVLRSLTLFAAFFADPVSGFMPVAILGVVMAVLGMGRRASPQAGVLGVVIGGHLAAVLLIAAHSPHQVPSIFDSADRMLIHILPEVVLLAALWRRSEQAPQSSAAGGRASLAVLAAVALVLTGWLFKERYYLRILPVPKALFRHLTSSPEPAMAFVPAAEPTLPAFDLTTASGLAEAVSFVRGWSPMAGRQIPWEGGADTGRWLSHLRSSPEYCTDAAQFLMLLAARQNLPVREIHLWASDGYAGGDAHTIMEFWNPRDAAWIAVDGQTGTLYRERATERLLGVVDILRTEGRVASVAFDRVVPAAPSLDPQPLLAAGIRTPVINLVVPPWLGTAGRLPIIGYALMTEESSHDRRIITTKWSLLALVGTLVALTRRGLLSRRR
jgi:hypothetical protein